MEEEIRVLVVDDEQDIQELLKYNLEKEGFVVGLASNGKEAIQKASDFKPRLILLDVMMPQMDGIETCEEIRKIEDLRGCIIAMLTARNEDYSQIAGFNAGADDYISKPIRPKVLISRINALLRRVNNNTLVEDISHHRDGLVLLSDGIELDLEGHCVFRDGEDVLLTRKEFELLRLLYFKRNKVITREHIFSQIWGNDVVVGERTIDVHIRKIREKTSLDTIKTIKGVGYKYE